MSREEAGNYLMQDSLHRIFYYEDAIKQQRQRFNLMNMKIHLFMLFDDYYSNGDGEDECQRPYDLSNEESCSADCREDEVDIIYKEL